MDEPVIIVDSQGVEHEFPSGMDPKRAAAIVRSKSASAPQQTRPDHPQPNAATSDAPVGEPDTWAGGFFKSIKDQGKQVLDHLVPALDMAANPKSVGDLLNLAIPEMGGAIGRTAHTAAGPVEGAGRILESVGQSRPARMLERFGPLEAIYKGDPAGVAASIAPSAARGGGRILQKAGQALRKPPPSAIAGIEKAATETPIIKGVPYRATPDEILQESLSMGTPKMQTTEEFFPQVPWDEMRPQSKAAPTLEEQLLGADQQGKQMAQDTPWNGDPVEEALDRSSTRRQESFTDRVNGSDTPDESVVNYTSPGGEPDPNAILGDTMPLGKPRVKTWKSGAGPSDELIGSLRDEEGSKSAARRLAIPQKQVLERAPRMGARQLPPEAQGRITDAMAGMTPEEKLTYLASAPNGLSQDFIKSLMEP